MNYKVPFLSAVLALASCTAGIVYSHYQPLSGEGWLRTDTICFYAGPMTTTGSYGEELCLRTNSLYPFTRLQLVVSQQTRPEHFSRTDTVTVDITDDKGAVEGEGICHYLYQIPLPDAQINSGDTLLVSVRHNMIRHQLKGVTDVGFTLSGR